jgi:hypothetical protein
MQEIEVDAVVLGPLESPFAGSNSAGARRVLGLHFADDETILASPFDGLGDYVLGAAIAIKLGGVDQHHAEIKAKPKRGDLLVEGALALSHAPCALAELRHFLTGWQRDGGKSRHGHCQPNA